MHDMDTKLKIYTWTEQSITKKWHNLNKIIKTEHTLKAKMSAMIKYESWRFHIGLYTDIKVENLVNCTNNLTIGAIFNKHKLSEINMESDVYTTSRGPNISCMGYKGIWRDH